MGIRVRAVCARVQDDGRLRPTGDGLARTLNRRLPAFARIERQAHAFAKAPILNHDRELPSLQPRQIDPL